MAQLYKPKSSVQPVQTDKLFFRFWIRWQALTVGERFVCANIILTPVWWVLGISKYMSFILLSCIAAYEWLQHREIRLKLPSTSVVALFVFGIYQIARILIDYSAPGRGSISSVFLAWFTWALLLWYIQSNNIRLRIEVIAWACTVSVIQMLGFWFLLQFVLPGSLFKPSHIPTLYGLLTGGGDGRVLEPFEGDLDGYYRLSLFFTSAQFFSLLVGCIGLFALEIKNRIWSLLLVSACVFLIVLSLSRISFVAFPIVVVLRYLFSTFNKPQNRPAFFGLAAVASFSLLFFPMVAGPLIDKYRSLKGSVVQYRSESTELRLEIYRQTWKAIQENPVWGYTGKGAQISLTTGDANVIGSHSVILGALLYNNGLVGTGIFAVFWISLFIWLYKTRAGRPLACFCVLILFTLSSWTLGAMWFTPYSALIILLCAAIRNPQQKFVREVRPWLSS